MNRVIVTRDSLQQMLDTATRRKQVQIIGRALVGLYKRQTDAEQRSAATSIVNGIGFAGNDAYSGTTSAKVFIKSDTMKDWVLDKWLKKNSHGYSRITKYHKQLNEIAFEREQKFEDKLKGVA